ncbi:myogenesis-regulating glycosidase-like isoform X1 [Diabrotica undecimpunctata]|uniref:myogenesis-regulating glycosidase-like isoform X1 n=1 Tax=Diabrotica undecimpunctata TaxID=50387 RepID=UPI003B63E2AC
MSKGYHKFFTFLIFLATLHSNSGIIVKNGNITLQLEPNSTGINFAAYDGKIKKLEGNLGHGINFSHVDCIGKPDCVINDFNFSVEPISDGFRLKWKTFNTRRAFQDCYDLTEGVQWYGGPTIFSLIWPIQTNKIDGSSPYVLNNREGIPYAERYWLNSKGSYIFLNDDVPLYVDQNNMRNDSICFKSYIRNPFHAYFNRTRNVLQYYLIFKDDVKQAHLHAVNKFLGKPKDHPNEAMVAEPIWTTWAKYKTKINDSVVLKFAKEIRNHGYEKGQIEIDDNWERCYGAEQFSQNTFSNIKNTVKMLKSIDFRVTLWIHPFVNANCSNNSEIGLDKGYFVSDKYGRHTGWWWNSDDAYVIDFTNPEATEWWLERVKKLQTDIGFDSFKFDAGETDFSPQPAVYKTVDQELIPNIFSGKYLRICATFGNLIEVRSGWRTQDLPIFTRMLDKTSNWNYHNGLKSLVTTLIQMNMVGYTMLLPDMIGGNGYGEQPDAELFVRWTQANTFMPTMQFSFLPWDFNETKFDVPAIVMSCVKLHKEYSHVIIDAMKNSVVYGSPVNPPIWWIDPTDQKALKCDDEFLVGEKILVAPVLTKGATERDVYLPKGKWKDGNDGTDYQGPVTLRYTADITTIPFFILQQ